MSDIRWKSTVFRILDWAFYYLTIQIISRYTLGHASLLSMVPRMAEEPVPLQHDPLGVAGL